MCVNGGCVIPFRDEYMIEGLRRQEALLRRLEAKLEEQKRAKKARKLQPIHRAVLCGRTAMLRPTIDMGS
jgi:hypothetical protein